jgi:hypothetical protein
VKRRTRPPQNIAGRPARNKSAASRLPAACLQTPRDLLFVGGAESSQPGAREIVMAKGQMRSNKEKKKPKADKNLKKGGAAPVNPFAAGKTPAGQSPNSKKS